MGPPEDLRSRARDALAQFFFPQPFEALVPNAAGLDLGRVSSIYDAYCSNIEGLHATITGPYSLALNAAYQQHSTRISIAERIRSLKRAPGEISSPELALEKEKAAAIAANKIMQEWFGSAEGQQQVVEDCLKFLQHALSQGAFAESAAELIRQGTTLSWSAFEVCARDSIVFALNSSPHRITALLESPSVKRRVDLSRVSIDTLIENDFNLSGRMGSILASQQDMSDLTSIKAICRALFSDDEELRKLLDEDQLRLLSLRRNLIVHRCGIVDAEYNKRTGADLEVGRKIQITPDELEQHIVAAGAAAVGIMRCASKCC